MKTYVASLCLIFGLLHCSPPQQEETSNATPSETEQTPAIDPAETQRILTHHMEAFLANDLEATLEDYSEESVLITPNGTYKGLQQIRENFIGAFKGFPKDSCELTTKLSVVEGDVAYIIWEAKAPTFSVKYGTDTFIIRDGKINRQTFAGLIE